MQLARFNASVRTVLKFLELSGDHSTCTHKVHGDMFTRCVREVTNRLIGKARKYV